MRNFRKDIPHIDLRKYWNIFQISLKYDTAKVSFETAVTGTGMIGGGSNRGRRGARVGKRNE